MLKSSRAVLVVKSLLSLWLIYQVFVITIMPNGGSYLGRFFQPLIYPYANTFGFNSNWNFFSPDPAHTMYFKYIVYFSNEMGEELRPSVEGYLPSSKNEKMLDPIQRRELYMMHFMILNTDRIPQILVPYLCKKYPGATQIRVEHILETIPPLDRAAKFTQDSMTELSNELQFLNTEFTCPTKEGL